jgi:hypothetical protein
MTPPTLRGSAAGAPAAVIRQPRSPAARPADAERGAPHARSVPEAARVACYGAERVTRSDTRARNVLDQRDLKAGRGSAHRAPHAPVTPSAAAPPGPPGVLRRGHFSFLWSLGRSPQRAYRDPEHPYRNPEPARRNPEHPFRSREHAALRAPVRTPHRCGPTDPEKTEPLPKRRSLYARCTATEHGRWQTRGRGTATADERMGTRPAGMLTIGDRTRTARDGSGTGAGSSRTALDRTRTGADRIGVGADRTGTATDCSRRRPRLDRSGSGLQRG